MGRRWLHSVDLETDGEDRPLAEQALIALGAAESLDLALLKTATVGASAVLPTAFGVTLPADLARLVLVPRGDVYWAKGGAASASTAKVPTGGINLPVTKAVADTIQVFAAGVACDLMAFVPRS